MKKKILISVFALIAVVGLFIAATPKSQPPNFETAFTTFGDLLDDWLDARENNPSDTASIKAVLVAAVNYIKSNWTDSQVEENVNALWPVYPVQGAMTACLMQCRKDYYICNSHIHISPGEGTCDEDYVDCKAHCTVH